jgi:hypothetical protein
LVLHSIKVATGEGCASSVFGRLSDAERAEHERARQAAHDELARHEAEIADMLDANRPKAAIARFVYVSESTLRFWPGCGRSAALRGQFREIRQIARKSLIFSGAIDVVRAAKSLIFGR